jgi:DNA-binding NarL/FixJ family response regulator
MIRVLIVDGNTRVRWGLRMRLAIEQDMAIVGETGSAEEALTLAQTLGPDAIVVDIGMQGTDGVNVVRRLRAVSPTAAVVILTLRGDEDTRAQAQQAGAQAFLEKYGGAADLIQTIRRLVDTSPLAKRRLSVGGTWNENRSGASEIQQPAATGLAGH